MKVRWYQNQGGGKTGWCSNSKPQSLAQIQQTCEREHYPDETTPLSWVFDVTDAKVYNSMPTNSSGFSQSSRPWWHPWHPKKTVVITLPARKTVFAFFVGGSSGVSTALTVVLTLEYGDVSFIITNLLKKIFWSASIISKQSFEIVNRMRFCSTEINQPNISKFVDNCGLCAFIRDGHCVCNLLDGQTPLVHNETRHFSHVFLRYRRRGPIRPLIIFDALSSTFEFCDPFVYRRIRWSRFP